jgi:transcriptional regulator with XRE-family HTH domain
MAKLGEVRTSEAVDRRINGAKWLKFARLASIVRFDEFLKDFRRNHTVAPRGESQEAFARRCGLSTDWVKSAENRRLAFPPPQTLQQLSERLGVPLATLQSLEPSDIDRPQHRLTIPADLWAQLEAVAADKRVTVADVAILALREFVSPARLSADPIRVADAAEVPSPHQQVRVQEPERRGVRKRTKPKRQP